MKLSFHIYYTTYWGQDVYVYGNIPELGNWTYEKACKLIYDGNGICHTTVNIEPKNNKKIIAYKYFLRYENENIEWESGKNRIASLSGYQEMELHDYWRSPNDDSTIFFSAVFKKVYIKRFKAAPDNIMDIQPTDSLFKIRLNAPNVNSKYRVGLIGNQAILGNWKSENVIFLKNDNYPIWEVDINLDKLSFPIEYKYAIVDVESKKIIRWEEGENRKIYQLSIDTQKKACFIQNDEKLRISLPPWKGAGVSIPIFSLRTKNSFGIGEFSDLKLFADWANKTNLSMIQILPVNDTTTTFTWRDSYLYSPISVFALHPIYLNIDVFFTTFKKIGCYKI